MTDMLHLTMKVLKGVPDVMVHARCYGIDERENFEILNIKISWPYGLLR